MMHRYFTCLDCGKNFATSSGLKQHQHIHKSIKPFQCKVCCRSYTQFSNLCRHKRMHADCRQQIDCTRCGQIFSTLVSLNKHKRFCEGSNLMVNKDRKSFDRRFLSLNRYSRSEQKSNKMCSNYEHTRKFVELPGTNHSSGDVGKTVHQEDEFAKCFSVHKLLDFQQHHYQQYNHHHHHHHHSLFPFVGFNPESTGEQNLRENSKFSEDLSLLDSSNCFPHNNVLPKHHCLPLTPLVNHMLWNLHHSLEQNLLKSLNMIDRNKSHQLADHHHFSDDQDYRENMKKFEREHNDTSEASFENLESTEEDEKEMNSPIASTKDPSNFTIEFLLDTRTNDLDLPLDLTNRKERFFNLKMEEGTATAINNNFKTTNSYKMETPNDSILENASNDSSAALKSELFTKTIPRSKSIYSSTDKSPKTLNKTELLTTDSNQEGNSTQDDGNVNPLLYNSIENIDVDLSFVSDVNNLVTSFTTNIGNDIEQNSNTIGKIEIREVKLAPKNIHIVAGGSVRGSKERYSCRYCLKQFPRSANLTRHLRTHTGEQPYRCQFCRRRFSISSNLQRHVRNIHNKEKPFHCRMCDRRFGQQTNLDRHYKKHENQKQNNHSRYPNTHYDIASLNHPIEETLRSQYLSACNSFYHHHLS